MTGSPSTLLEKYRRTLLDCGPFANYRLLVSTFADDRIASWNNEVPDGNNAKERVDFFVSDFLNRENRAGQSALLLPVQARLLPAISGVYITCRA